MGLGMRLRDEEHRRARLEAVQHRRRGPALVERTPAVTHLECVSGRAGAGHRGDLPMHDAHDLVWCPTKKFRKSSEFLQD